MELTLHILAANMVTSSSQWEEECGLTRQRNAFLCNAMINDLMISKTSENKMDLKKNGLSSKIDIMTGCGTMASLLTLSMALSS